ncbi:hypothetical protein M406DRAFT_101698 [Cryphonectria parasitica EP155]|uniref:Uncharacterized protein n=1 Tax=Cryphonectria parasitica (strain ATCC 38755 / EP155) TaxID=660469 RepID=A0A9P4Y4J4_CRYP1|nr:uncharacterized protein M406DRAFT_101698 [Cryphonectria parasitica EP155]KAF3766418.1 hypothetical protein M406DRAFT_101698 [Cryphonectria parasitica EP155]
MQVRHTHGAMQSTGQALKGEGLHHCSGRTYTAHAHGCSCSRRYQSAIIQPSQGAIRWGKGGGRGDLVVGNRSRARFLGRIHSDYPLTWGPVRLIQHRPVIDPCCKSSHTGWPGLSILYRKFVIQGKGKQQERKQEENTLGGERYMVTSFNYDDAFEDSPPPPTDGSCFDTVAPAQATDHPTTVVDS